MLPVSQAEQIILDLVQPVSAIESLDLALATGRILANEIVSRLDFPHWDNSAMDGYAVKFADVRSSTPKHPITLEVVEEIPAGYQPQREIQSGEAARIFTGAIVPAGADTIVMQEHTQRVQKNFVKIQIAPTARSFVRQRGEYACIGDPLLAAGTVLNPPEIAILAATGCSQVEVYRRPRVAILSTGDELVTPHDTLKPGQIVDSNQYALAAFVTQAGGIPICMGIIPDDRAKLTAAMSEAIASADFVLSTGGVSVGDYDYVEAILAELGGDIQVRAVAIKPGKPLTVAKFKSEARTVVYFGLPGNPVSALVSCWRFVKLAIAKFSGLPESKYQPTWLEAITTQELTADGKRETYLWGQLELINGRYEFSLAGGTQSSANLINLAGTNALAVVPIDIYSIEAGATVQILVL
ncbi:gephyrin-like molybdotransferase Glp [Chamaesiphon minutus]|uniref:Molybdopterin molybdenumtransferase n=1 Tax=Chamaesiphon minutus (strain ATCC 27169 / PCC 6605) TaxID=1173020 RepID=K9ULQ6_CHAP6|nr:gephyrin-like molybdotransferase Glp [Chamaesiphon minutus]AFY96042.1 molybdenum cofactor synthesis domain protein [Chamaesiphon minutus PCC 6605]